MSRECFVSDQNAGGLPRLQDPRDAALDCGLDLRVGGVTDMAERRRKIGRADENAIDAVVAETALRQQRPVVLLTSDTDDMAKLCGDRVRLIAG